MARVLLDTNVLIDMVVARYPEQFKAMEQVVDGLSEGSADEIYVSPLSIKDMCYFLENSRMMMSAVPSAKRRRMFAFEAREAVFDTCTICAIDGPLARYAHDSTDEKDYDDALIAACAETYKVDAIITRDKKAFRKCSVPCLSPKEAAKRFSRD